jgi:hypothetical protein
LSLKNLVVHIPAIVEPTVSLAFVFLLHVALPEPLLIAFMRIGCHASGQCLVLPSHLDSNCWIVYRLLAALSDIARLSI